MTAESRVINWQTHEQVEAEARKGPKAALAATKLFWLNMSTATLEQLEAKFKDVDGLDEHISYGYWGLCHYYRSDITSIGASIKDCPLYKYRSRCCCSEWMEILYLLVHTKDSIAEIYPALHRLSGDLYEKIKPLEIK